MLHKLIGALTIGQAPRPDLIDPLRDYLPQGCQLLESGALDGTEATSFPYGDKGDYPLRTRLRDGSLVQVEESFLLPRLQKALERLEAKGVVATILLCAGTFVGLRGERPLFKPYATGRNVLQALGLRSIGLIAPIAGQEAPIRHRWQAAGFAPTVWTADLSQQDKSFRWQLEHKMSENGLECIVLDYVGHPLTAVRQLQNNCPVPVFDLGQLAMASLAASL